MIFGNAKPFQADFNLSGEFSSSWTPIHLKGPWEECFGWTVEELSKIPFYSLIHPDDLSSVLNLNYRQEPGQLQSIQCRNQCKDGEYKPMLWLFYVDPHTKQSHVFAQDLSTISINEFLLEQSQTVARIGSWTYDIAKKKFYWTKGLYALHGLDPQSFTPTRDKVLELYEELNTEEFYEKTQRTLQQDVLPEFDYETIGKKTDGSQIRVRIRCRVAKNSNLINKLN
jgi:PAS domain-containing protein